MIRRTQIVLISICLVLFFFTGMVLMLQNAAWPSVSDFGMRIMESIPSSVLFWVFLLAIVVILLIGALELRHLSQTALITREGEEGRVTIVESAITRYIKQVAADIESVQSVRTRITNTPQGLVVDLYAHVLVTDTLPRIEQTIRTRVREALEQTLGVGGVAAINVVIEGFQKVGPAPAPPETSREIKLTSEPRPPEAGGESAGTRWGRLFRRQEPSETGTEETKPEESKPEEAKPAESEPEAFKPFGAPPDEPRNG